MKKRNSFKINFYRFLVDAKQQCGETLLQVQAPYLADNFPLKNLADYFP